MRNNTYSKNGNECNITNEIGVFNLSTIPLA